MSAAKPYVVVCHYELEELEHGVARHMRAGYVPTGSVSNLQNPEGPDYRPLMCQAMVWQPGSGDRKPEQPGVPADGMKMVGTVPAVAFEGIVSKTTSHIGPQVSMENGFDGETLDLGRVETHSINVMQPGSNREAVGLPVDVDWFKTGDIVQVSVKRVGRVSGPLFGPRSGGKNAAAPSTDKTDGATDGRTA